MLMLMMISMGAWADVDVLLNKEYEGGKVAEILQEESESGGTTVYITVSPAEGFTVKMEDVHVEPVIPASSQSSTRTPELAKELTLSGSKKTVSYPNYAVYSFTVPDGLNAWVKNVEFQKKREGAKGGEFTLTYHIINLGKLDNNGKLTKVRTEALQFTSEELKVAVPDKYKSPLAKNWKYYSASDVTFDQDTRTCTLNSGPSLNEADQLTLTANTDIYVTYELDENALNTVGLADGGIYRISRSGKKFLYQSHWQGDPNVYFDTSDKSTSPTDAIYLWKFNIVDPYQITIQSKSADYYDYFLSSKAGSYGDIRLRSPLGTAKENKVWSFGLLNGESGYRLIITDGYKLAPDGTNGLDDFGHGYLNNNDNGKARYQKYAGNDYKNSDLTFVPLEHTYTYNIVNKQGNIAISTELTQTVGKLSGYNDIPESIRSPYIDGETVTFYSFTGDYSSAYLSDENIITEMPLTDANIYVTYTTNLTGKFLNLQGTHAYNIKVGDNYIYDSGSGTLSNDPNEANKGNTNHLWYFTGGDPYSIQVENVATGYYLNSSSSTLLLSTTAENFILINRTIGEGSEQIGLKNATGEIIQMNAIALSGLSVNYYLIDKAGKLIFDPQSSTSEELVLPSEWVSPLVSKYHYYKTITYDNESETYSNPTDEISSPAEVGNGGNIYVTYDAVTTIDFSGTKTYLLKFHDGVEFNQEDGSDAVDTTPMKAVYPYNNGDFHLYVYGDEQWVDQQAKGSSTRSRWLWKLISENNDPYHVIIKSNQNQSLKVDGDPKEGHSYLRTYKPDGYTSVVTGVAYENPVYFGSDSWRNGNATEYMILGTSLDKLILKTFDKINDGNTDERRKVTSFEQYWKNNPTAYNILKEAGHTVTEDKGVNVELSTDEKAVLTGLGWHTYQVWANSADWSSDPKKSKSMAIGWHWFQTISMGSGEFSIEEFSLEPQVILIDQHGWEIMRLPLSETEKLKKFDSPMVKEYKWYPFATKAKADGYHKYSVSDISGEIKVYVYDGATKKWKEDSTFPTEPPYTSTSLALNPYNNPDNHIVTPTCTESTCTDPTEHSKQPKSVMTDFLVIYTVKSAFANSYKGASSANETSASAFLVKQNGNYATIESSTSTSITPKSDRPAMNEDVPEDMLWYMRPNFDIDYEMGYIYAGETGAQEGAKTKEATEADYVAHDQNGFDPYNVQIQSKAYPLRYFTSRTTGSELDGGIWTGTSSSVELQNLRTDRQTATGYDHTTLNITNATFMVVDDGSGNMLLMPRFDQQTVMSSFSSFTSLASVNESMSVSFEKIEKAKVIHSSSEIDSDDMSGNYVLAPDFTFTSNYTSLGTESKPFKGTIDGQLNAITAPSVPLVAYASESAVIKNVILEGVSITTGTNVGAICNEAAGNARIYNCGILSGSVGGTGDVGGIVGSLDGTSRVINCYSYATITGGSNVGGIVGNNKGTTTAGSINTMVMNCMFYGDITGGSTISPVYGGNNIDNLQDKNGLNTFNYYAYSKLKTKAISSNKYNCALAVEDRFLSRFEIYRQLLNSNKKLAAYYVTGNPADADQMAKWVLETADRTIENPKPYPVLKAQGYYPSIINPDFDNAPDSASVGRNKGGILASDHNSLTVTIRTKTQKTTGGQDWPSSGDVTRTTLSLPRTDMDPDRFNFNYDKVQLPYYNDIGTGNYTDGRVVTGWKITNITNGTEGTYTESDTWGGYNFADRKCKNKDLYSVSKRVFAQGAYYDVPYGVTAIEIEPYWGYAAFVADEYYDYVYTSSYGTKTGKTAKQVESNTIFNGKSVKTSINNALSTISTKGSTVFDNAIVLVGNLHQDGINKAPFNGTTPFTIMSLDNDNDHEPDYSLIYHDNARTKVCSIRFDFLNIPGTAQAQKPNATSTVLNASVFSPKSWFEITNTCNIYFCQFEYEFKDLSKTAPAPVILLGGVYDQFTSTKEGTPTTTSYLHVGGSAWFKEFNNGTHSDGKQKTKHVPISVTGGDYDGFYLTGTFKPDAAVYTDDAECYISSGHFKEAAGAGQEKINGNVKWQIYNADIDNFYGGGINSKNPIQGDITIYIYNSYVGTFCGGPKFGDMQSGKKVTTNATGCKFNKFFGAGFGGTAISKVKYYDLQKTDFASWQTKYSTTDRGNYFDGATTNASYDSGKDYGKKGLGVATDFDYDFFIWTSGGTGGRFYVKFASFSLAQCNDVESTLNKCVINGNFYGGGSLGKVVGNATSVLEDCEVKGNAFGAGFSATLPKIEVRDAGFAPITNADGTTSYKVPGYNKYSGMFEPGTLSGTTEFEWKQVPSLSNMGTGIDESGSPKYVYTDANLNKDNLGSVSGAVNLTIKGNSVIGTEGDTTTGHVYGGGDESYVNNIVNSANASTTVNILDNTIVRGSVYGGGNQGVVSGNTNVNICAKDETGAYVAVSGNPIISGNVYGGGKGVILAEGEGSYECAKAMVGIENEGKDETNPGSINKGTNVRIGNGTVGTLDGNNNLVAGTGNVYGGGQIGRVEWNTIVTIGFGEGVLTGSPSSKPVIEGSVFGAGKGVKTHGYSALVRGNSTVTVQGNAWVKKSVYGGGEIASVGRYNVVDGLPTTPISGGECFVNILGCAEIGPNGMLMTADGGPDDAGHVFGAGKGVLPYEGYEDDEEPQHMDGHKDDNDKWVDDLKSYPAYGSLGGNEDANYSKFLHTLALASKTHVTIDGNAFIKGSVYGGGENGFVQADTYVTIAGGQIGCGKNTTERYSDDVWKPGYVPTTDLECASWTFGDGKPYDKYAGAAGYDAKEGALVATDGHTFYGNVFAGGSGYYPYRPGKWFQSAGRVNGNTNLTITGGHILTNVYGGNEMTDVVGSCTINMSDGTVGVPRTYEQMRAHPVTCYIFGAGKGDPRVFFNTWTNVGSTQVNISGSARIYGSTFGGGEDGHVLGDAETNINTGSDVPVGTGESATTLRYPYIGTTGTSAVDGNIFGGGRGYSENALTAGVVCGNVRVNIHDGTILGSIFGGGRLASVGTHLAAANNTDYYGTMIPDGKQQVIGGDDVDDTSENPVTHGHITITIDGGSIGAVDNAGKLVNSNYTIGDVFGGSKGSSTDKRFGFAKSTSVTISEPNAEIPTRINRSVFGGGEAGNVEGDVAVTLNGGIVGEDLYGGGALADTNIGNWNATLNEGAGGFAEGIVGEDGKTKYKTEVNLLGGTIKGDAFGGGLGQKTGFNGGTSNIEATTYGDITVTLGKEDKSSATAFNTTYENTDEKDENNQFIKVVKSGRLFGTNNLNGSPKGNVMVNVYCTQNKLMTTIAEKFIREKDSDIEKEENENTEDYVTRLKGILTGKIALAEALNISVSSENKALCTDDNAEAPALKTAITSITTSIDGKTTEEINGVRYDMAAVYGGGNLADYTTAGKKASVIIHTCDVSVQDVYGGGNAAAVPETDVLVKGAYEIEHVFGGGNGKDKFKKGNTWMANDGADVLSDANTLMIGGYIHEAYGGSNEKGKIHGSVHINSNAKDPDCDCVLELESFYTAGNNADVDGDAIAVVDCMPDKVTPEIYGGAKNANVKGNVELTIRGGTFGKVFGGNNQSGAIFGHIILNIEETNPECSPIIIDELYGCGNMAAYSVYGYYQDGTDENGYPKYVPRTSANDHVPVTFEGKPHTNPNAVANKYQYDDPVLNIISCTRIGKVFGGGLGSGAVVYGNPTVNINQMKGVWAGQYYPKMVPDGNGGSVANTNSADLIPDQLGEIGGGYDEGGKHVEGGVFGGGNEAEVKGNTTVNIGTATTVQHHLSYNKDTGVYTMSEDKVVLGANIIGNVYGGGNKANVTGSTKVNIGKQSTP